MGVVDSTGEEVLLIAIGVSVDVEADPGFGRLQETRISATGKMNRKEFLVIFGLVCFCVTVSMSR
jgi:hypothetical protein